MSSKNRTKRKGRKVTRKTGFASMSKEKRKEIARKGGKASARARSRR
ncbi:MAG: KGG domain-containing protein [Nitrososphaerales archaeon]